MTQPIAIPKKEGAAPTNNPELIVPGRPVPKPKVKPTLLPASNPVDLAEIVKKERLAEQKTLADRYKQLDHEDEFAKTGNLF